MRPRGLTLCMAGAASITLASPAGGARLFKSNVRVEQAFSGFELPIRISATVTQDAAHRRFVELVLAACTQIVGVMLAR